MYFSLVWKSMEEVLYTLRITSLGNGFSSCVLDKENIYFQSHFSLSKWIFISFIHIFFFFSLIKFTFPLHLSLPFACLPTPLRTPVKFPLSISNSYYMHILFSFIKFIYPFFLLRNSYHKTKICIKHNKGVVDNEWFLFPPFYTFAQLIQQYTSNFQFQI